MNEKFLVLERSIERDLEIIDDLFEALDSVALGDGSQEDLIVAGYRLHALYNACENIFVNIARAFANNIDDRKGWHAQVLERMRLDLRPLRPAVIDEPAFEKLDELRRFRHLFRSAYGIQLDAERMALACRKAAGLRDTLRPLMEEFLKFLRQLPADGEADPT